MPPGTPCLPRGPIRAMDSHIRIRGARQNNLNNLDVDLPRRSFTVVTGPSGSGKSSLALDTLFAEGQRRYVESLSTYAKQFLERMPKPEVDWIDGVAPSVAIDQRNTVRTSRSTVGTVTETYDYLRLLWSRVGHTVCPECGVRVIPDTVQSATDDILTLDPDTAVYVAFPLERSEGLTHAAAIENLRARGYVRVVVDGLERRVDDLDEAAGTGGAAIDLSTADEALVVVDRLTVGTAERERIADAVASAFAEGHGRAEVLVVERERGRSGRTRRRLPFTEAFRCTGCGRGFPEPTPILFSFNHPTGACTICKGFGATLEYAEELIVPDERRSLADGALDPWTKPRYRREAAAVLELAARRGIATDVPWSDLPEAVRRELLEGGPDFVGMLPFLRSRERKRYKQYIRVFLRQYQLPRTCSGCGGARLRPEALNVRIGGRSIGDVASLAVAELLDWSAQLPLSPFEERVADTILRELRDRIGFMNAVGLGYLTLDRQARTLSGGEMQRIRLAGSLGSRLVDTLYVLDEPTIGLHPRDVDRFMGVLESLRDRRNTVLVVEHQPAVLRRADRVLELGPGAGDHGGELVFEGTAAGLIGAGTATGRALREAPTLRSTNPPDPSGPWLRLEGATLHNVRDVDLTIPLGRLTVVSGVSGSGKSTLVHDVLYRALEHQLHGNSSARRHLGEPSGAWRAVRGAEMLEEAVLVDQSPIGRTPRSNPVTYIKAYDHVRRLFAEQPEARRLGLSAGHFSFNVEGGRCEACKGAGEELVEMVFLADVSMICEVCEGRRFRPEVLQVRIRGRSIRDVLDMTVDEAIRFFIRQDRLGQALWQLQRVGLGYLRLGQPATTLSGGEAQRLKVARELARRSRRGRRIYIMDEPTVGLGLGEIGRLLDVLDQLVSAGHTVVVVEHDLDVVSAADWVIDVGPEAAGDGGRIVVSGTPADVMACPGSHTGRHLLRHRSGAASTDGGAPDTGARAG